MKRYYRVRAYDTINGNSGATNEAFAVTNLPGPGELTVTSASSTALNLNFSDNTDGETSYEIWQSTNAGAYVHVHTLDPNAEQGPMVYQRTGLNPGTTYSFRVRAKNDAQASIFTLHETATTAGANITVDNPSFEASVPNPTSDPVPGWDLTADEEGAVGEVVSVNAAEFPEGAPHGSKAVRLVAADGETHVSQLLGAAQPNTHYELKVRVGAPIGGESGLGYAYFQGGGEDDSSGVIEPAAAGEFALATLSFDTGATVSTEAVEVVLVTGVGDTRNTEMWFDDVRVTATPLVPQAPVGGTPWAVPGVVEFEDFDEGGEGLAYHDTTGGNTGGYYRRSEDADVDIARDDTGGYSIGWAKAGEWLEYTINVPAGQGGLFDLTSYLSAPGTGGQFHWELDGNSIGGTLAAPPTGGYYDYEAVVVGNVAFSAGDHVLRLVLDTAGDWGSVGNFNYFTVTDVNVSTLTAPTNLVATGAFPTRADLTWEDNSNNEMGFEIQYREAGTSEWFSRTVRAETEFYALTGLNSNSSYYFQVRAISGPATSEWATSDITDTPDELVYPTKINFQVDRTPPEPGYLIDSGDVFAERTEGLSYGWNTDHTIQDRERGLNSNRLRDTLVHMRDGARWSIVVPNGEYSVTVGVGDAAYASRYSLSVNGVPFWNGSALSANQFQERKLTVNVTNGKITLDNMGAADRATRLNYVEIEGIASSTPESPTGLAAEGIGFGQIRATWHEDQPSPAGGYRLYRSRNTGFTPGVGNLVAKIPQGQTRFDDLGLSVGKTYHYVLTAVNGAGGESQPTGEVSAIAKTEDTDVDNDGVPNTSDNDNDNDGVIDSQDVDDDQDGTPDGSDSDDIDSDNDGIANWNDDDNDNDGVPDANDDDNDNDGTMDEEDLDDDNDGTADSNESVDDDNDNDGSSDSDDIDDDIDGVDDSGDSDDDQDGIPDEDDSDDGTDGDAGDAVSTDSSIFVNIGNDRFVGTDTRDGETPPAKAAWLSYDDVHPQLNLDGEVEGPLVGTERAYVSFGANRGPFIADSLIINFPSNTRIWAPVSEFWDQNSAITWVPLESGDDLFQVTPTWGIWLNDYVGYVSVPLAVDALQLSESAGDVEISATYHGLMWQWDPVLTHFVPGDMLTAKDTLRRTYGQVSDVQWELVDSPLQPDEGGVRMFPDKRSPDDTTARDTVDVVATVHPMPPAGTTVSFKSFDVDDPSSDEVHSVIDPNDTTAGQLIRDGRDNRGTTPGQRGTFPDAGMTYTTSAVTDAEGKARVRFQVTQQPGDNFRIGAATNPAELDKLSDRLLDGKYMVGPGDQQLGAIPVTARLTNTLTVWRHLWIERDSMEVMPAYANAVNVKIKSVALAVTVPSDSTPQDVVTVDAVEGFEYPDEFEGGTLEIPAFGRTIKINRNTETTIGDETLDVPAGSFTPAELAMIAAGPIDAVVFDDDRRNLLPHAVDGGTLLESAYADAFILPVYADSWNSHSTIPFAKNLSWLGLRWEIDDHQDLESSHDFWSTLVVACHEYTKDLDGDPDGLGPSGQVENDSDRMHGASPKDSLIFAKNTSAIFLETINDDVREFGAQSPVDEAHTVVHEIAHTAGALGVGHTDDGIMMESAPTNQNKIDGDTLLHFRTVDTW